ncbi:hypothetical protein ACJMK2_029469 [Sinanodonta woodiana]|uniref:Tryptophan--tRNA ligase, mitochondrial n=1 Tax=Sinanodonta woodiana TaxID=1069815 RepID=A0ABD3XDV7_SINWO
MFKSHNIKKILQIHINTKIDFFLKRALSGDKLQESLDNWSRKKDQFARGSKCILSGIQPSGIPHLGNYIGAIKKWVDLQDAGTHETILLSIVDLHAITVPQERETIRNNIVGIAACLLACGVNPSKTILFQQSTVSQHTELAWILSCLCTIPRLECLPQWKEKSQKYQEPGVGLFIYPVLQAADILLYKATEVPVGEDQVHHLELARHLAKAFNRKYGVIFPRPMEILGEVNRIKSLRDPCSKMSKSEANHMGRIELTDSSDEIHEKIKKSVTDFTPHISYDPDQRPGVSNLIQIHAALTGQTCEQIVQENAGLDKVAYKSRLAEIVNETLAPIRTETARLLQDKHYISTVLDQGRDKANLIASKTYSQVKGLVGFS